MTWSIKKRPLFGLALAMAWLGCGSSSQQGELERMNRARAEVHEAVRTAFGAQAVQEARAALASSTQGEQVRREHFVAPDGAKENDGSESSPWDLAFALSQPSPVRPGDVIWLAEGTYPGPFTSQLIGARSQPIVVRAMPGARAVINSCGAGDKSGTVLTVNGESTWFWGIEVTGCSDNRRSEQAGSHPADRALPFGIDINAPDIKVINCAVHDAAQGIGTWGSAKRNELYGNIIFHNGWDGPDRGHGHGIYLQNDVGTKRITHNIIFRQFGNGIHAYGEEGSINHLHIMGNVSFLNGALSSHNRLQRNILVGGGIPAKGLLLERNYTYHPLGDPSGGSNNVGYQAGCEDGAVANNYFAGPTALDMVNCGDVKLEGNFLVGEVRGVAKGAGNLIHAETPSDAEVVVLPNTWEPGRATVVVFNWLQEESVSVDLSAASFRDGHTVEIRNVEDYYGEPRTAVYSPDVPLLIPMKGWTPAAPAGMANPAPATPTFGVFVLQDAGPAPE